MAGISRLRVLAVAVTTTVGLVVAGSVTARALHDDSPDVYVYFKDASPLIAGNDVKAGGVKVGQIGSIDVEDGMAKVGLVLDDSVLPLHQDATARVRPVGLLGERYVELDRGSADAPVLDAGASLSVKHTSSATDLDEVLDMVDGPTGTSLSFLITALGQGVMGRGKNVDDAIKALAPALQNTDRLAEILDQQNDVLAQLLDSVEPVARQVAIDDGRQLDNLVGSAGQALDATARNDDALASTLAQLPGALNSTRETLAALTGAATSTTPVLRSLRPLTDDLVTVSRELDRFSRSAGPALDGLDPVLARAQVLIDRARPVARILADLSPDMESTARNASAIGNSALDHLSTILDFVKYWALTTNGQDGLSHYFRAHLVVTSAAVTGLVPATDDGVDAAPEDQGPLSGGPLGDVTGPLLNGLLGQSNGGTGPLNPLLGGLLGRKRDGRATTGGTATGLSSSQERSLLTYLIGGK